MIKESDTKVDVLIISMHWGTEYQDKALPGVRDLAKTLVTLGADAIVGHHPHWVQDWEMVNGRPVYYSLGNLVFDQMWSEHTKKGLVVKMYYDGDQFKRDEKLPTYMKKLGRPEFFR